MDTDLDSVLENIIIKVQKYLLNHLNVVNVNLMSNKGQSTVIHTTTSEY